MRLPAGVLVLALVESLAGCGSPRATMPTAPTATTLSAAPAPSPAPEVVAGQERWNVTVTYVGHTGPEACIEPFDGKPRQPVDAVLLIQHVSESIHLLTEHNHYIGRVRGHEFSAVDPDDLVSTWQCGGARIPFRNENSMSGRFSEDGGAISGEEVAVFRLESGETIRRHWSFTGTRQ